MTSTESLAKARDFRLLRAEFRREVETAPRPHVYLADELEDLPEYLATLSVLAYLCFLPHVGPKRARNFIRLAHIEDDHVALNALSSEERAVLGNVLRTW